MTGDVAAVPAQSRLRVEIQGAVQGVGFRPFVYRLAAELELTGWVINDTRGVFIEVEGPRPILQRFLQRLPAEKPPRSIIQSLDAAWLDPAGYQRFEIRHSDGQGSKTVLVLPDIATCAECLADVLEPANRRLGYPFTNCTNCGPRFSIIQALPYDRPNTTMGRFILCPDCEAEYEDPLDRRFHAQPNACPVCGPRLALLGRRGAGGEGRGGSGQRSEVSGQRSEVSGQWSVVSGVQQSIGDELAAKSDRDALKLAARALREGRILAVKGLGGFHLMVDAGNPGAIQHLRERKPRRDKPFAVMLRDLEQARQLCQVSDFAGELLVSPEAPIVLLARRSRPASRSRAQNLGPLVAEGVAPGNPTLGIMLPYTPLHHLLMQEFGRPVVATSGNLTDEPICTDEREAMERLGGIADLFLVHDRPIERHVDDSVAWIVDGEPRLLRRARGYAPLPVMLARPAPTILAVGAHLKNTVALSVGRQVFISQHIGDLETAEALAAFERVIADFLRLYEATPVAIAHDLHPDYLSTRWARESGSVGEGGRGRAGKRESGTESEDLRPLPPSSPPLIPVQHHHAHLASCLVENGVDGPALGVTWDGTGYGTDGTVWGGEFLLGDASDFQRVAHLRPFRLPGGDAAVKEPRRVALAMLWELYGDDVAEWEYLAPVQALTPTERRLLIQMLRQGLNAPITTSAGRLFDGIAGLIGLHQQVTFEGQAAMALEFAANPHEHGAYPLPLLTHHSSFIIHRSSFILDWSVLVEAILADLQRGVSSGIIAARFHHALVEAIVTVARQIGVERVALTGGCFQNRLLTEGAARRLRAVGFDVLLHHQVPPNDGGISLGQVAVAAARLRDSGWLTMVPRA